MSVISDHLAQFRLGRAQTCGRMGLYPLLKSAGSQPTDHGLSARAFEAGTLHVGEVSDSGVVSELKAVNDGDQPVLLLDGEELQGAKQNRILNVSVLVASHTRVTLPVSCVEQGRWHYRSPGFAPAAQVLFSKARSRKAAYMAERRRAARGAEVAASFQANQMAIWDDVEESVGLADGATDTGAMSASYEAERARLEAFEQAFRAEPEQVGAVFCIDDHPAAVELLETPDLFAEAFPRLLRGHGLSTLQQGHTDALGPAMTAADFVTRVAESHVVAAPSVGLGEDLSLDSPACSGSALCLPGRLIHLAAFSKPLFSAPARH